MLLPSLSLDELRRRVREAEASLRVAQQYARDARENPDQAEHASARIQALCREVQELFPGLDQPPVPDPRAEELSVALGAALHPTPPPEEGEEEQEDEEEDGEEGDGEEGEWDIDYDKLAAAIDNPELMSRFPEPERATFRDAALYLIESHQRQELFAHVIRALEEVSALAQLNVEDTHRRLAVALTLEAHAAKNKD